MATKVWTGAVSSVISVAGNWSSSGVPAAGDTVIFQPGYTTAPNLASTALNTATLSGALGPVIFRPGWASAVGSAAVPFQFTCTRLDYNNSLAGYIDLEASTCSPEIQSTQSPAPGYMGLYLIGSALATVIVDNGTVGLAVLGGTTATATLCRIAGQNTKFYAGSGAAINIDQYGGTVYQRCASTLTNVYGGILYTEEVGAVGGLTVFKGGYAYPNSTGTITTLEVYTGGECDLTTSVESRIITNCTFHSGGKLKYHSGIVTFTNGVDVTSDESGNVALA